MCYGITSSSEPVLIVHRFQDLMYSVQLQFKEGNRMCRTENPGSSWLHECSTAVSILHQQFSKGIGPSSLLAPKFFDPPLRLFTKSQRKIVTQPRASHWHFNVCSITCKPPISPLVRSAFHPDDSDHQTDRSPSCQTQPNSQSPSVGSQLTRFYGTTSKNSTGSYKTNWNP